MADKNIDFTERLLVALKGKGIDYKPNTKTGLKKFAEDNEMVYTSLHKLVRAENRGHVPEWDLLVKISQATEKTIDWLLTGKEPPPPSQPILSIQETPRLKTFHPDFSLNKYVPVRLLHDSAAAGHPSEIDETNVDGWALIYADKKWVPGNPEDYTCCRVRGSSMYPILSDGDIVAIDHSQRDPRRLDKKMVAFRKNGGVTIKWLKVLDGGLVVGVPENKNDFDSVISLTEDEAITGIVGRVAWWWAKR